MGLLIRMMCIRVCIVGLRLVECDEGQRSVLYWMRNSIVSGIWFVYLLFAIVEIAPQVDSN